MGAGAREAQRGSQRTSFLTLSPAAAPCHSGQQPPSPAFGSGPAQNPALPSGSGSAPDPGQPWHPTFHFILLSYSAGGAVISSPLGVGRRGSLFLCPISPSLLPCRCSSSLAFIPHLLMHSLVSQSLITFILVVYCLPQCPSLPAQGLRCSATYSLCPYSVFRGAMLHIDHAIVHLEQGLRRGHL